ncbi:PAS domain-containing protein, partial [Mycobacterium tuberculosis]
MDAAIEAYHVDDRALVSERLEEAIRDKHGFAFTARIVRPDGEVRHVFSRGEIDGAADDSTPALFGIIQDITAQVAHEAALEEARQRAEDAAAKATIMAETDQLTGIANRRRTTFALEEAVRA